MKVKPIKIENVSDIADTAYRIAEEIADCVHNGAGQPETDPQTTQEEEPRESFSSDVDNITREEYDAILESEEFKAFEDEARRRFNHALEWIMAHEQKYNCSYLGVLTTLNSNIGVGSSSSCVGTMGSMIEGLSTQLSEEPTVNEIITCAILRHALNK